MSDMKRWAVAVLAFLAVVGACYASSVDQGAPGRQGAWPVSITSGVDGGTPVTQAFTTVALSADGGDAVPLGAPTNSAVGYALVPNYVALRFQSNDSSGLARTVTKWVYNAGAQIWQTSGTLAITTSDNVFDQYILVGSGRIYFQRDDPYADGGAGFTADVTAEERP